MGKRGPRPQHESIRALPGREKRRPPPPEGLTDEQSRMWRSITETEAAGWFDSAARQHLLRLYIEHATFRGRLQETIEKISIEKLLDDKLAGRFEGLLKARDRETKQLVSLATRMRLTNQSRYTPSAAGTAARNGSGQQADREDPEAAGYFV